MSEYGCGNCGSPFDPIEPGDTICFGCEREALRARVAELERHYREAAPEHNLLALLDLYEGRRREAESRASAAVEAHSELLSRIAGDGTLDAMERAAAAEQRAKRLEVELAGVCGAAESLLSQDSSAVDVERLRVRVREARAALAASDSEASHG